MESDAVLIVKENGCIETWIPGDKDPNALVPGHALLIAQIAIALKTRPEELLIFLDETWDKAEEMYNASIGQTASNDQQGQDDDQSK